METKVTGSSNKYVASAHADNPREEQIDLLTIWALIEVGLSDTTGLPEFERKLIAYYTLATHSLPHLQTFPMLVCRGPMGTGKSCALEVVYSFARKPQRISLRGRTLPVVRDDLAECFEGTAVIEEGDAAWKQGDAESLLSDRCQRRTAEAARKKQTGDGWETDSQKYFGATAIHRRLAFADAALEGRSIKVKFRSNPSKEYGQLDAETVKEGCDLLKGIDLHLPEVETLENVAPRIWDAYRPIMAVARLLDDSDFLEALTSRMQTETLSLREAQQTEPEALVLRALIEHLSSGKEGKLDFSRRVPYSEITDSIWKTEQAQLRPHQVGSVLRDFGFKTVKSHGVSKVEATPAKLIKACEEFGIEDECLNELKAEMQG